VAVSGHADTPYFGRPVTAGSATPYTTPVDVNEPRYDSQPSFQPFAEKFGEARAVVTRVAMNPAQMILQAEPAVGRDRADHTHSSQPDRRFAPRAYIWRSLPAARNLARSTVLLTPGTS
jgi:hypothetical protein